MPVVVELLGSLVEISAVGCESGFVKGDYCGARGAGETRDEWPSGVTRGDVFGGMAVFGGYNCRERKGLKLANSHGYAREWVVCERRGSWHMPVCTIDINTLLLHQGPKGGQPSRGVDLLHLFKQWRFQGSGGVEAFGGSE